MPGILTILPVLPSGHSVAFSLVGSFNTINYQNLLHMQKGTIQVQTENIFPIIKKFLYSDHDILLRELISNTLEETEKAERGTDIVLYVNEESSEFLEPERVRGILNRFCRFLPIPIYFKDKEADIKEVEEKEEEEKVAKPINNTQPAWTRKPS